MLEVGKSIHDCQYGPALAWPLATSRNFTERMRWRGSCLEGATSDGNDAFASQYPPILGTTGILADGAHTLSRSGEPVAGICGATSDDADVLAGAVSPAIGASILAAAG